MKKIGWLSFIFIILLIMNFLTPISVADDGAFAFVKEPVGLEFDVAHPIKNLSDIVESQKNHWYTANGRIVCESLVQLFIGILGKTTFNVVNALVFCLVLFLLLKLIGWENKSIGYPLGFLLFLLLIPAFGETVLWFTGSFNYLWTAFFVLGFLVLLRHHRDDRLSGKHWLLMPVAFICGWTHEILTLPVSMAIGLYMLLHIRKIWGRAVLPLMLGFMMGTAMNVLAPATFIRAGADDVADVAGGLVGKVKSFVVSVSRLKAFWVLVICIVVAYLKDQKSCREYFKAYRWLMVLVLFSFSVILLAGYSNARVHFGTEFLSLVALMALINYCCFVKNSTRVQTIIAVPLILFVGVVLYYQTVNFNHYRVCEEQMKDRNTLMILTPTDTIPDFWGQYLMKHVDYGEDIYYLACDKKKTMVRYMSALYGKSGMFYFPQVLFDDINRNSSNYDEFNTLPDAGLYVKRINGNSIEGKVAFELREPETGDVPFYMIPFAKYISAYSSLTCHPVNQTIVCINNSHYHVVPAPLKGMAKRVKRVVLQ